MDRVAGPVRKDQRILAGRRVRGQVLAQHFDVALRRGQLVAERHALLTTVPADPSAAIRAVERELDGLQNHKVGSMLAAFYSNERFWYGDHCYVQLTL